jgi:hypothetical protein
VERNSADTDSGREPGSENEPDAPDEVAAPGTAEEEAGGGPERAADRDAARAERRGRRRARRVRRWSLRTVAALAILALLGVGWLALRGYQAKGHLEASAQLVSRLQAQARAGDTEPATLTLGILQDEAAAARSQTDDPVWRAAGWVPWVGTNVSAVADTARAVDELAQRALPPLVETAASLDPATFAPKNGRVDVAALQRIGPRVRTADDEIRRIRAEVVGIDTQGLLPPLRDAVTGLRAKLDDAAGLTGTARKATTLLPPMLGADGPRTYLMVFQNPAEVRATGGLPGAYAVVRTDRGRIQLVGQGTAADLGMFPKPVLPLTTDQTDLYTDRLGTFAADVNFTPHFPTAAKLFKEMYQRRTGGRVDAVVATDPVAMSYLLEGSAGLPLPGGETLRADNAVRLLLSEVYARYSDPDAQDAFFAAAARAIFEALSGGRVGGSAAVSGLTKAADEHRVLVWSTRAEEQRVLEGTVLAGELPERDGPSPLIGVFMNDGTGAKMSYYLRQSVEVVGGSCRPDRRREIRLRITVNSTAPRADGLPDLVADGRIGLVRGVARTNVLVFAPVDGAIQSATVDGKPLPLATGTERNRRVGYYTADLGPGDRSVVDLTVLTAELPGRAAVTPQFWTTPTVTPWIVRSAPVSCGK